jgi:hypothetical protein
MPTITRVARDFNPVGERPGIIGFQSTHSSGKPATLFAAGENPLF